MAWMKRRDNSGGQRDYLNAEDTAGRPMALASILFTLLFIAAIVLLLFSAGRWAYNQMIDEEVSVSTTQQDAAKTEDANKSDGSVEVDTNTTSSTEATVTDSATANTSLDTTVGADVTSTETAENIAANAVPNTGPGSLLGIFVCTVLVATIAHIHFQKVKNRQ